MELTHVVFALICAFVLFILIETTGEILHVHNVFEKQKKKRKTKEHALTAVTCDDTFNGAESSCVNERLNKTTKGNTLEESQCYHMCKKYEKIPKKHCGFTESQLNKERGVSVHEDHPHVHSTVYDTSHLKNRDETVSYCKSKCNRNPRCGSFVLNGEKNHCLINEKNDDQNERNKMHCMNDDNAETFVKPFDDCQDYPDSNWYCEKDFGHRFWY